MKPGVVKYCLVVAFATALAGIAREARCEHSKAQPDAAKQAKIEPPAAPGTQPREKWRPDDWDDLEPGLKGQAAPQ